MLKVVQNSEDDIATAAQRLFLHLLDTFEGKTDGIRQDLDVEFLHEFRVAVRRTRSLLTHMKSVLPCEVSDRFLEEFAWLGGATGPARDLDVQLLQFPVWAGMVKPELREFLRPLHSLIQLRRESERHLLMDVLASPRYQCLTDDWRKFLQNDNLDWRTTLEARRAAIESARSAIWRRYRKVLKRGAKLQPDSPDELFHRLRKECKKLRYLLECFFSLFPAKEMEVRIKVLKRLQNNLGEYQDLSVQLEALNAYADQLKQHDVCDDRTLRAIAVLADGMETRKKKIHDRFVDVYERFAQKRNQNRFKALFKPRKTSKVG